MQVTHTTQAVHWKMLEVLAQEVAEKRWPYAAQAPYPSVNSGNQYLHILLDVFASEDPRFWAVGLHRCPAKGTFCYIKAGLVYYGETAARVFLDIGGTMKLSNTAFLRMLYADQLCVPTGRVWLSGVVKKLGRVDVTAQMAVIPYPTKEAMEDEARE
jgi:hypothetical protein